VPGSEPVEGPGPRARADVRDAFILDTLASIDGMLFVRVAFDLADCRPTAGERPIRSEPAPGMQ
jgi:hypothetical protein